MRRHRRGWHCAGLGLLYRCALNCATGSLLSFAITSAASKSTQPTDRGRAAAAGGVLMAGIQKSGMCWRRRATDHRWRVCWFGTFLRLRITARACGSSRPFMTDVSYAHLDKSMFEKKASLHGAENSLL